MKTLMRGLTLAAMLLAAPATQAEIVIDPFSNTYTQSLAAPGSVGPTAIENGVSRSITISGTNGSMVVGTPNGVFDIFLANNGVLTATYNLTGASINRNWFVDQVLRTGLAVTGGTNVFDIAISVASAGFTTATANLTGVALQSQVNLLSLVSTPGVGNGHLAAFSSVDSLTIQLTNTSGGNVFFRSNTGLAMVPEPASMSLLGLTAIGGFLMNRRRKTQVSA